MSAPRTRAERCAGSGSHSRTEAWCGRAVPCPDFRRAHPTRRTLLKLGAVGLTGLSLPGLLRAERAGAVREPKAKSVIWYFMLGGTSHLESFDMKTEGPESSRGQFKPISSNLDGVQVCELQPRFADAHSTMAIAYDQLVLATGARWRKVNVSASGSPSANGRIPVQSRMPLVCVSRWSTVILCP